MPCNSTRYFEKVFNLEGNLSSSQHLWLRQQTIESGGGFDTYITLMEQELGQYPSRCVELKQDLNTGEVLVISSDDQYKIATESLPEFCAAAGVTDDGVYEGDRAQQIWAIAQQYAE